MEIVAGLTGVATSNVVFGPENSRILQTDLRSMHNLVLDITIKFENQQEAAQKSTLKIRSQPLHNSLAEGKSILYRSEPRQWCLSCPMCNPGRLYKEIKEWKVLFNYFFHGLQGDFSVFVSGNQIVIAPVITLINDVIHGEENRHILQTELKPMENLLLDIRDLFQDQQKMGPETLEIWLQHLHNSLTEAKSILLSEPRQRQRCLDCIMCNLVRLSRKIKEWKVLCHYLFHWLERDFSIFLTATLILKSSPLTSLLQEVAESQIRDLILIFQWTKMSIEIQPLSEDEAWMLFQRIALNNDTISVSMDIQKYAKKIADECKVLPLAIAVVAAAMIGKTSVVDWENSLDLKTADPSFPDTHRCVDPDLYQRLRLSYDAFPNSNVQDCFLFCVVYPEDYGLPVEHLVQMWIAEGLVIRSKQESHLMTW